MPECPGCGETLCPECGECHNPLCVEYITDCDDYEAINDESMSYDDNH